MIKLLVEAENPKELHEFLSNLQDGYNDEILDTILETVSQPPEFMTDTVSANEMFSQLYEWFKKNKDIK